MINLSDFNYDKTFAGFSNTVKFDHALCNKYKHGGRMLQII